MSTKNIINWDDKYSVGVKEIDAQHKKLIDIINQLNTILKTDPQTKEINQIITKLVDYKKQHFATEEKYFKKFNYEHATEHIETHRSFTKQITRIQEANKEDEIAFGFALIDFLEDWLIGHFMTVDRQYIKCFHEHGLK